MHPDGRTQLAPGALGQVVLSRNHAVGRVHLGTAGVGLLQGRRWGWYLAMAMIGLSIVLDLLGGNLLGLLIDALVIFLLTRPATRAKFGVR